jgi:hypothetical protein
VRTDKQGNIVFRPQVSTEKEEEHAILCLSSAAASQGAITPRLSAFAAGISQIHDAGWLA